MSSRAAASLARFCTWAVFTVVVFTANANPATNLTVLPGFKAELVRASQPGEGSWISMTIDNKGRFIISPEKKESPLLRITVGRDGAMEKIEQIPANVRWAMGLLYAHKSLYLNGHGPKGVGLYRLIDANKNDQFETEEAHLLINFDGDNEHGYHAVVLGPDKMIYVNNGNMTKVPPQVATTSPHRNYAEDLLLPRQWDAGGHAVNVLAPGGHVLRTDPEGKKWELLYGGFRNTYDIDFAPNGEMFTFDSDMEWDIGAPWYRPTRILHCVIGGEYGWRSGSGKWPVYYPDSLPAVVDVGLSSPTGVKFGTGSNYPEKYKRAFYACDWSYGRILAVHLQPQGATYAGTFETFVSGRPLNVVDLEFGKDGAMYFITGGWRTQSELYRVSMDRAARVVHPKPEVSPQEKFAAKQRAIRHKLEAFHGKSDPRAVKFAWPYLSHPDQWLRFAARVAIESQGVALWQDRALAETDIDAATTALLALCRNGDKTMQKKIVTRLSWLMNQQMDDSQLLSALRVWQLCFVRMGKPDAEVRAESLRVLAPLYPADSESKNRELCQLLVYLDAPDVLAKSLALMEAARTQEEQMYYAFVLRNVRTGWSEAQRKTYFAWFNKAMVDYRGGNSFAKYLINIRQDALNSLSEAERLAVQPVLDAKRPEIAMPEVAPRPFVKEWKMEDVLPSLDLVSKGRSYEKGRDAYAAAQCAQCHRFGTEGGSVGPDLTAAVSRFGRRDLLECIIEPSKVVGEKFQTMVLTKHSGEDVSGWIIFETPDKVRVVVDPVTTKIVDVPKSEIESRRVSQLSPMPDGLVNTLTKEDILDLLAYIESGGSKESSAFASK